jgi:protein-L-isoaspartate(D-aspartate) O-methyltransferase
MTLVTGLAGMALAACATAPAPAAPEGPEARRERMVKEQIQDRGVKDARTLAAMRAVPRHLFVPEGSPGDPYGDYPLPIGHGQTISQPYIVAFMTEALALRGGESVLEIGTGSGYQSAVLSRIASRVHTIEIVPELAAESRERLKKLGYDNVEVRAGDGYLGWPEAAPFDAIIVTAAAPRIPEPLKQQLADGGRLVVPVGDEYQELIVVRRRGSSYDERRVLPVRFVPMTGAVRKE